MLPLLLFPPALQGPVHGPAETPLGGPTNVEQTPGAQPTAPRSRAEARAFFLYSLTIVTDWPAQAFSSAQAPMDIAILGDPGTDPELVALAKRTAHGRPIRVVFHPDPAHLETFHVVYVGSAAGDDLPIMLRVLKGRPALIIGELPALTRLGGMVFCDPDENLLPTEVNVRAARDAGLTFRSQFLKMVKRVSY